jgi:adenylate cyclase
MSYSIESRLSGTKKSQIIQEFFNNSAHFPIVNIFLEMLLKGMSVYFLSVGFLLMLMSALLQAYWLGRWQYEKNPHPLFGNLIGVICYTIGEIALHILFLNESFSQALGFFEKPYHLAYWIFSILIGVLQYFRSYYPNLIVLESMVRISILGVMYWIFEQLILVTGTHCHVDPVDFFADKSHTFISLSIFFLGIVIGFAHLNAQTYLKILQETSRQLQCYSEWLLGRHLLDAAMKNPESLSLNRRERTVIFVDIRGFTQWSELQNPEAVVAMLNQYFSIGESCWLSNPKFNQPLIKTKYTGDEIMLVMDDSNSAIKLAQLLSKKLNTFLKDFSLGTGIGIHCGFLVEGLLGSQKVKAYDVIGDTVNTAKRICDHAMSGEILLSETIWLKCSDSYICEQKKQVKVKGKREPLTLFNIM